MLHKTWVLLIQQNTNITFYFILHIIEALPHFNVACTYRTCNEMSDFTCDATKSISLFIPYRQNKPQYFYLTKYKLNLKLKLGPKIIFLWGDSAAQPPCQPRFDEIRKCFSIISFSTSSCSSKFSPGDIHEWSFVIVQSRTSFTPCFEPRCPLIFSSEPRSRSHAHTGNTAHNDSVLSWIWMSGFTDTWMTPREQYGGISCFLSAVLLRLKK